MGYYTYYHLDFLDRDSGLPCNSNYQKLEKDIIANLAEINPDYFSSEADSIDELFKEEIKWYDHEEDMKLLSSSFPNLIFTLSGEGEDNGDNWIAYFCDGEVEICYSEIVYEKPKSWFGKKVAVD